MLKYISVNYLFVGFINLFINGVFKHLVFGGGEYKNLNCCLKIFN